MADDFIREVDDDLRRKQLENFWSKYGRYIVGLAVLIVTLTAANVGLREYRESRYQDQSAQFAQALDQLSAGQTEQANLILAELSDNGDQGYRFIAALQQAKLALDAGETEKGLNLLDEIAVNPDIDNVLQDFAILTIAMHKLDNGSYEDVAMHLNGLISADNTWQYVAQELLAIAAYKAAQYDEAVTLLSNLVGNVDAPRAVQIRAEELLAVIR